MVAPGTALGAGEQVQDGGFEAGFPGWVFDDGAERCEVGGTCGPFAAASGNFYAASKTFTSLGPMAGEVPVGTITQLVPVPELPATLSFALREVSGPIGTLDLLLEVRYDGQVIEEITAAAEAFETVTIPIPGALGGPTSRPLTFEITCSNFTTMSDSCARFDIDDVSLIAGTAFPTPPTSGTIPQATPPDLTPPQTTMGKVRKTATVRSIDSRAKVKARFASESGARFECKLDRRAWSACKSPRTLRLKVGKHVFQVRAIDPAGNVDPAPARVTIRVKLAQT